MKQHRSGSIVRRRSVCWLLALAFAGLLVLALALGAKSYPILSFAIIGPGSILALVVLMGIGLFGLLPSGDNILGLEGSSIYMLASLLMGVVFWWSLALALLLRYRRKLLASETASGL